MFHVRPLDTDRLVFSATSGTEFYTLVRQKTCWVNQQSKPKSVIWYWTACQPCQFMRAKPLLVLPSSQTDSSAAVLQRQVSCLVISGWRSMRGMQTTHLESDHNGDAIGSMMIIKLSWRWRLWQKMCCHSMSVSVDRCMLMSLDRWWRQWIFFFFFLVLPCPLREIQIALLRCGTAAERAAPPIPFSVCSIFVCPNNGVAVSVQEF